MYTITADPGRKLITIALQGMLTPEQVAALYRDEHLAIQRMGCRVGEHLALVDLTGCPLQIQDVASAFQRAMDGPGKARRLALFTGSSLARMQIRRIMRRSDAALFETRAEAEAWLFADDARAAA
ncbi:hypothetical protein [Sphingomonas lenta]|uniref:STAS/SEC14 domain-containing protein n=1 Tax=Sphingomonas lenta TaxID=1141887 RepID=A0A2A2SBY6_9SPHN|nr:hypothetical protein [Sphingomonas lenta]PAX06700.1 hypothetical protein CKY28_16360 [Sphingomonas lenta]